MGDISAPMRLTLNMSVHLGPKVSVQSHSKVKRVPAPVHNIHGKSVVIKSIYVNKTQNPGRLDIDWLDWKLKSGSERNTVVFVVHVLLSPPRTLCTVNRCTSWKIAVEKNNLKASDVAQKVGISDSRHPRKTITKKYLIGNHSRLQESLTKWNWRQWSFYHPQLH